MTFISKILGKPVSDLTGDKVGSLEDVVVSTAAGTHRLEVVALAVKSGTETVLVPLPDAVVLVAPAIPLSKLIADVLPYQPTDQDLFLARDVLDKQLIDVNGARIVRVNDIELGQIGNRFYLMNVDGGALGLVRRLGLEKVARRFFGRQLAATTNIPWDQVELLPEQESIRIKVPGSKIKDLHPADLAEIISDLTPAEGSKLLQSLDVKTVADALEEVEPDFQATLVKTMEDEKVADVLEEMAPDKAADLLAELPEERGQGLLKMMDRQEADDVRKLLAYPEDSAGGIMTTAFAAVRPDITAEDAMRTLRQSAHGAETIFYVYVADEDDKLVGVFSLKDLVLARPDTMVRDFMRKRVVSVKCEETQEDVAHLISKYNLLAVPVLDAEGRLQGIVTADDALDHILPTTWKKRLPRMYQ